jgi:hypothetical protein
MRILRSFLLLAIPLLLVHAARLWAQGPPFQTDDPVPIDLHHYEFYIFGTASGTPVEMDSSGPAFEFNWGAIPLVQLHAVLPFGSIHLSNNPIYLPSGTGPSNFGLTDMELGVKLAWIKQTSRFPQIGSFTMIEIPTGDSDKGLGVGKVWYKLPLWAYKDLGKWTLDGGAGFQIVPQTGFRNFPYGGFLIKRELNEKLEMAAEIFSHAREGEAPAQTEASTMIDAGGLYHLKGEGMQLLFAYGHSVAGQTENYAYLGLYWTWGKDDHKSGAQESQDKKAFLKKALFSTRALKSGL